MVVRLRALAGKEPIGMWYFAYGSNLNVRAVTEWCRHYGHRPPTLKNGRPAVLDNYRLCFPIFSEYWNGGIGDIVYDPGKYVAGALFDLSEQELKTLDAKVDRRLDPAGREIGIYQRIEVTVAPLGKGSPVQAITYQGISVEKYHIPPTRFYMDLVIQGAYQHGLSMMWISYLQSFSTQAGKKPRPPGYGDVASKL
jgi:AIG2-like family